MESLNSLDLSTISLNVWFEIAAIMTPTTYPATIFKSWSETVNPEVIKTLTLAEWDAIAVKIDRSAGWAFVRWVENTDPTTPQNMKIEEWEAIADKLDYARGWAYKQYQTYRA